MLPHVIRREFLTLARSRPMIISTILIVVVILIAGVLGRFFLGSDDNTQSENRTYAIVVEDQMADYLPHVEAVAPQSIEVTQKSPEEAESYLRTRDENGSPQTVILGGEPGAPEITASGDAMNGVNPIADRILTTASVGYYMQAAGVDVSAEQYSQIASTIDMPVSYISTSTSNLMGTNPIGYFTSFIGLMLLFMSIIMGLTSIGNGVVEEKSSRVVEILLTSIRPRTLLLGKIIGIGSFLLLQFFAIIVSVVVALNIAGLWVELDLGAYLGWMLVWLVLGFFFYAMIMGAVASTASRQEDLGAVTTPVTMFLLIPFYVGLFAVPSAPDSIWPKIFSMFPGFAPFVMPVRQAYGDVPTIELVIAVVVSVLAIPLVAAIAGKIYENSILHTGKRMKITQALRA